MFAYCNNNPVTFIDINGCSLTLNDILDGIANVAEDAWDWFDDTVIEPAVDFVNVMITKASDYCNHINMSHITKDLFILDGGWLFGKIWISTTTTVKDKEEKLFYSYKDIGNKENKTGVEMNVKGWLGIGVGGSSEGNVFVNSQITPWIHSEFSVGIDGVGGIVGIDIGYTTYDFELKFGWGSIIFGKVLSKFAVLVPAYA